MTKRFQRGLVVGKFCPLHRGHEHLIRTMWEQCERSFVLSYTRPEFPGCEPEKRRRWLERLFPEVESLVLAAVEVPANEAEETRHRRFVAELCRDRFGGGVDAVFTSEDYGEGFARELSEFFGKAVVHVAVDPERSDWPVSGTLLRSDVHAHRGFLSPEVYGDFVERICLLGGESSGKSTLASALADHYGTLHVAEYGRELWEKQEGRLVYEDLLNIARVQVGREEAAAGGAQRYLFCDTSPLTTWFYCQSLFGRSEDALEELTARPYTLHVLCGPEIPFHQDGTRRDAAFREEQHRWYREELERRALNWMEVQGTVEERIAQVFARLSTT